MNEGLAILYVVSLARSFTEVPQLDCRTDINRESLFSSFSNPTSDTMKRYALGQNTCF